MANDLDDPFTFRAHLRLLGPRIEDLAAEYDRQSEPLRTALNAVLDAPTCAWLPALYAAGEWFSAIDFTDGRRGSASPPDRKCSDRELAVDTLFRLARAAAARDHAEFDTLSFRLADEPKVAVVAAAERLSFVSILLARSRQVARLLTLDRARDLLSGVGLELTYRTRWELAQAGCVLSAVAEDVISHWADGESTPGWPVNGRLAPLGCRQSLLGGTGGEVRPRADESPKAEEPRHHTPDGASSPPPSPDEQARLALVRIYSGGVSDTRILRAAGVINAQGMNTNDKLTNIHDLMPIPPTASSRVLGQALGVSHTAVENTAWWKQHRKGQKQAEVGRREMRMRGRGKEYERPGHDEG